MDRVQKSKLSLYKKAMEVRVTLGPRPPGGFWLRGRGTVLQLLTGRSTVG